MIVQNKKMMVATCALLVIGIFSSISAFASDTKYACPQVMSCTMAGCNPQIPQNYGNVITAFHNATSLPLPPAPNMTFEYDFNGATLSRVGSYTGITCSYNYAGYPEKSYSIFMNNGYFGTNFNADTSDGSAWSGLSCASGKTENCGFIAVPL